MAKSIKEPKTKKRVYGRRNGRPMNQGRVEVLETLLPELSLNKEQLKEDGSLKSKDIFGHATKQTWFEIGFGSGEHLAALMQRYPEYGFIGAEPFSNGVSSFLKSIENMPHENIRVLMDDAMMIAHSLADHSLDGIYVLNPDPWHKKRHHKRRIINPANLDVFSRILKPGGQLIMSTDVPDLADWMITHSYNHPDFIWAAEQSSDWLQRPDGWITTKYEEKGAKGAQIMVYLKFERK